MPRLRPHLFSVAAISPCLPQARTGNPRRHHNPEPAAPPQTGPCATTDPLFRRATTPASYRKRVASAPGASLGLTSPTPTPATASSACARSTSLPDLDVSARTASLLEIQGSVSFAYPCPSFELEIVGGSTPLGGRAPHAGDQGRLSSWRATTEPRLATQCTPVDYSCRAPSFAPNLRPKDPR